MVADQGSDAESSEGEDDECSNSLSQCQVVSIATAVTVIMIHVAMIKMELV